MISGVYYRREDYASFWRRLAVDAIDLVAGGALAFLLTAGLWTVFPSLSAANGFMAGAAVAAFGYFVVLKRSRFRTLGCRLCGVRIVGLDGRTPGWGSLIYRLAFALVGPLNWVVDLMWLSGDVHRQALRDKYAHTYVIKASAEPAGTGKVGFHYYEICGYNFLFREVEIGSARATSTAAGV
jgi:uncharacterized RDD family membrane protein YckC